MVVVITQPQPEDPVVVEMGVGQEPAEQRVQLTQVVVVVENKVVLHLIKLEKLEDQVLLLLE